MKRRFGYVVTVYVGRGFGFLRSAGEELFFHFSELGDGLEFDEQLVERRVSFLTKTHDGKPEAAAIEPAP